MKPHKIIMVVPPGLEDLALEECLELGLSKVEKNPGWLVTYGHDRWIYRLNNLGRIPSRILIELASFKASSFSELESKLTKAKLGAVLGKMPVSFKISVKHCRLYHTGAIEERILRSLGGKLPQSKDRKSLSLFVRGEDDHFTVSLDSTGDHLHRRGMALHRGEAPLRENLAAALIRKVDPQGAVWDPTCGSGTLLLETILYDTRWPLCRFRNFAFEDWPSHKPERYQSCIEDMERETKPLNRRLIASDLEEKELQGCRANLERVGCLDRVKVFQGDLMVLKPDEVLKEGVVLSNPPYGERLSGAQAVLESFESWGKAESQLSSINLVLPRGLELSGFRKGLRFRNGGIGVASYHCSKSTH